MYHPYLRGKQFELITVRENAELIAARGFVPIIEPVRNSFSGLNRALGAIVDVGGKVVVVVNPQFGDHKGADGVANMIANLPLSPQISAGVLATEHLTTDSIVKLCNDYPSRPVTLIHSGFTDARSLGERLAKVANVARHVFIEESCGKLYRRHFAADSRVLIRDGFQRRRNREHPEVEFFSDLHATFREEGVTGFGDFLVVGDDYSEGGGPAYAVAIHLTFIDPKKDDGMYVYHFVSDRTDTPTDPAGKFSEALAKLVAEVRRPGTPVRHTKAIKEFFELYDRGHFPGLGYIKKLSMQHHIETLAAYSE